MSSTTPTSTSRTPSTTIIIALTGTSCTGKTTLVRLLRSVFTTSLSTPDKHRSVRTCIVHQDDFFHPDSLIPIRHLSSPEYGTRDVADWDCAAAFNLPSFEASISYVKQNGKLPDDLHSKEDHTATSSPIPQAEVDRLRVEVTAWLANLPLPDGVQHLNLCVVEGILLLSDPASAHPAIPASVSGLWDVRLFLPMTLELLQARRDVRGGYVTLEGFWRDPPGYVRDVVWGNHVRDCGWVFRGGNGNGDGGEVVVNQQVVEGEGIRVGPGHGERSVAEVLLWGVETVKAEVGRVLRDRARGGG